MLEDRRSEIRALVEEHIRSGEPVSSRAIVDRAHLSVSSATVRNDLRRSSQRGSSSNHTPPPAESPRPRRTAITSIILARGDFDRQRKRRSTPSSARSTSSCPNFSRDFGSPRRSDRSSCSRRCTRSPGDRVRPAQRPGDGRPDASDRRYRRRPGAPAAGQGVPITATELEEAHRGGQRRSRRVRPRGGSHDQR